MNFLEKYRNGETGWEINRVDSNLVEVVMSTPILPCEVLDIGCGTGNNVIWLQEQGFIVTGIDSSELAVQMAKKPLWIRYCMKLFQTTAHKWKGM